MTREEATEELQSYAYNSWGELSEAFKTAIKALKQPEWISVKDRLPEKECDIIAYYNNGVESRFVPVNYSSNGWYDCVFNSYISDSKNISHWMNLCSPTSE